MLPLCYQSIYPSSSSSRRHRVIATVTSWCHLHVGRGFVVAITVSPLSSHCRGVVIAIVSLRCLHCRIVMVSSSPSQCRLHCHIVAVSSLPLWCHLHVCHGFVIAVAVSPSCLSWFCHCHHGVAFIVALSQCHCHSRIVVVPSLSHCCGFVITIVVSPSSLHCRHFVIAIMVLPLRRSQFRHCCHSVTFMSVVVSLLPSWCHLRRRIVMVSSSQSHRCGAFAVALSWFRHHCHGVAFIVALSQFCCCCGVAFIVALSRCHCHGFVVAIAVSPSHQSQFC